MTLHGLARWWAYANAPRCQATVVTLGGGTGMEMDDEVCWREGCDLSRGVCMADRDAAAEAGR